MYLSALKIQNFRQFGADQDSLVIEFNKGVTALVGENDAGKSSVIDALRRSIEESIPNSKAEVAGGGGHYQLDVVSPEFTGKGLLDRQRLVYSAIAHLMKGDAAPVHAVDSLKTRTPETT